MTTQIFLAVSVGINFGLLAIFIFDRQRLSRELETANRNRDWRIQDARNELARRLASDIESLVGSVLINRREKAIITAITKFVQPGTFIPRLRKIDDLVSDAITKHEQG